MHAFLSVHFTDVVGEVDFQSLDQEPFLHQFLVQRLDGSGKGADGRFHEHMRRGSSISTNHHICRELQPDRFQSTFVYVQTNGFSRHFYNFGINWTF